MKKGIIKNEAKDDVDLHDRQKKIILFLTEKNYKSMKIIRCIDKVKIDATPRYLRVCKKRSLYLLSM
jgi:hypothetical protein